MYIRGVGEIILRLYPLFFACAFVFTTGAAWAEPVIDQEQPDFRATPEYLSYDGGRTLALAQSFTVGLTGILTEVRVAIGCAPATDRLIIEIREIRGETPDGDVRARIDVSADSLSGPPPTSLVDFVLPAPIPVTRGEMLAIVMSGPEQCEAALGPVDDPYGDGKAFVLTDVTFGSGFSDVFWLESGSDDLVFQTLVEAAPTPPPTRGSGRCVIPGKIDPSTGLPLELPISRLVPACRCFEDAGAREFRCGILHPDFLIIRRLPFPLPLGKPYGEVWRLLPLTRLDAPVTVTVRGAGFEKPQTFSFAANRKFSAIRQSMFGQTVVLKAVAPENPAAVQGMAVIEYPMDDAEHEFQKQFGLDISINESVYGGQ